MHNGPQLYPALSKRTLQRLHRPRHNANNQHALRDTRSRPTQGIIKRQLRGQRFGEGIITRGPNGPQRPISRKPGQPLRGIPQWIACRKVSALDPEQLPVRADNPRHSPQAPLRPPLTSSLPAQLSRIPPHRGSAFGKRQRKIKPRIGMIENDIVLRQPIEPGMLANPHCDLLPSLPAIRLVPLGRPRRSDNSMRTRANRHVDIQPIATRNPTRRMHDHRVADRLTFRIQRSLYAQRTIMQTMCERSPPIAFDEAEFEPRAPLRMRAGLRRSERDVIFVKRHANE
ncbi:hypothetical protein B0G83_103293 [Paraburkholderia sp. BL21I4N1]|nr:hypothetical protein B0G83_103293 [Paraburkholderia sp. BL21I4N1]